MRQLVGFKRRTPFHVAGVSAAILFLLNGNMSVHAGDELDFNRDIRPLLADRCFKCHGPDEDARQAGLRLDNRDGATAALDSGLKAVDPDHLSESELLNRIHSDDPDLMMPPPASNKILSAEEKERLEAWVKSGAQYAPHWAFTSPSMPSIPTVAAADRLESPIDAFIAKRLESEGLSFSPKADRYSIVRRLSLDLVGLPPDPALVEKFVADDRPDATERCVDRLLASPHYGERWARRWLDLARYADTNGYEKDRVRSVWPYRDWVINAVNMDMPFDRFTIEQLAGDMLPNATLDQQIATGLHRNTMLNEEGGIDPLEYRFYAMVDRVNTTGTIWLGLTVGCAQCHTHKYDPITHRDYYRIMALLNNIEEPTIPVPQEDIARQQAVIDKQIAEAEIAARKYPFDASALAWSVAWPATATSEGKAIVERLQDGSLRFAGPSPERDTYTVEFSAEAGSIAAIRIEALSDPMLPNGGPGRVKHGNFVLSEVLVSASETADSPQQPRVVSNVEADYSQPDFPAWQSVDGNPGTGWAVHAPDRPVVGDHEITLHLADPVIQSPGSLWSLRLVQNHGDHHTIGRFRVLVGRLPAGNSNSDEDRLVHESDAFAAWVESESRFATHWQTLVPTEATSNLPLLTILDDASIIASGDQTKADTYQIRFNTPLKRVTAVRLEAIADTRLPSGGPGRIYYEGPFGDFFLSEFTATADGTPIKFRRAIASYYGGGNLPERMLDGDQQSGWSVNGGQGESHVAIFELDEPVDIADSLDVKMLFERYYSAGLGRFRISVTTDGIEARTIVYPADVEDALALSSDRRSDAQQDRLRAFFLSSTPETELGRHRLNQLRSQRPSFPTALVMTERPDGFMRPTFIHKRGEFLQTTAEVQPELPSLFADESSPVTDRLQFARWLVGPNQPLTSRVAVNRQWAAFFGKGIVRTTEDFGYQGEVPSHPDLLDWLAIEFVRQGWSLKKLHRDIVTSAVYTQQSSVTDELLEKDSENRLLARGPRVRLEAELVRDSLLATSGLLDHRLGGPSVFPPQPAGITSEGTYGPLAWNVSTGGDRYRRALYTFAKRTAPYAMFTTFDAPSGEACVARREISNTPLQALTMLNDTLTEEAARTLGAKVAKQTSAPTEQIMWLFERCLSRPATPSEQSALQAFYWRQKYRLIRGEIDPKSIVGKEAPDAADLAAWTLVARTVLNLDEMIMKE